MADESLVRTLRLAAVGLAILGLILIGVGGASDAGALVGFALFCLAMAALDGLFRGGFGFRQVALLLGWLAGGVGLWALATAGLSQVLGLPMGEEVRALLIFAAACAAGAAASVLLAVTTRGRELPARLRPRPRPRAVGFGAASSQGGPRRGPGPGGAARRSPPAGRAPGG